jgi:hypothetical protein
MADTLGMHITSLPNLSEFNPFTRGNHAYIFSNWLVNFLAWATYSFAQQVR